MSNLKAGTTIGGYRSLTINDYSALNQINKLVMRDSAGDFAANVITANSFVGNVTTGLTASRIVKTGTNGVLEALAAGTTSQYLRGDGTWGTPPDTNTQLSNAQVIAMVLTGFTTYGSASAVAAADSIFTAFRKLEYRVALNDAKVTNVAHIAIPTSAGTAGQFLKHDGTWGTPPDTLNTAGSTDISTKIFLVGASSQAASAQTYSDNEVFATNGVLNAKTFTSTVATGTAPLTVTSTTAVANLQAATATKLHTARAITVGPTAKNFDGSAAITYTLAEIGINVVTTCPTAAATAGRVNIYTGAACATKYANWLYFET